ncbi:uncharacterized protein si:ch211-106e7.2 isoform X2 [Lates calcarifer]|uniref:Uncharacterized protein si:ch211-106e7.2 isoform X2 n=1 Tax=Lates calcarifer TaxID=8187 RepID=A0AAJ7PDY7_LATCA|nr:uncharacterized protein si:ch211-106e7.2 isoform X2 [Lates calcarifer]
MYSCAWMNGQHQQAGPHSQSSQVSVPLIHDTMRNPQTGTADDLSQYRTMNTGVRPPQIANFNFRDGACSNRQMSNCKTSAVPHQAVSSQQPVRRHQKNHLLKFFLGHLNATGMRTGDRCLPASNEFQAVTMRNFCKKSAQKSKTQAPPSMVTTSHQQDMSGLWNQPVTAQWQPTIRTEDGNIVSDPQRCRVQNTLYQNVNRQSTNPYHAHISTATSSPYEQAVYTSTSVSAPQQNRQAVHYQNHRQNVTSSTSPPNYNEVVYQSFRRNSITTDPLSNGQIWHNSNMSQKTQQYSAQLNSSINSNSNSYQYETSCFLQETHEPTINPAADTQQQTLRAQIIARIADSLRRSCAAASSGCRPVHASSPSEARTMECNQTVQPVTSTVAEGYHSNATQPLPLHSGQSLPNTIKSVMSRAQHIVNAPPQQSSVADVFCVTTTGIGGKNGSEAGNAFFPENNNMSKGDLIGSSSDGSQLLQLLQRTQSSVMNSPDLLEKLLSVNQNDSSIHSYPGHTGTRAVAVVQPLSQESYQVANKHTSSKTINQSDECIATNTSFSNHEKFISPTVEMNREAENPNQIQSNKYVIRHSAASSDGTVAVTVQLCADEKESELATNLQVDCCHASAAQRSVTSETPSQNGDMDKSDTLAGYSDLSSVPTTPWTIDGLRNLIQDARKAQMELQDIPVCDKLLSMFWFGNSKLLVNKIKTGYYKDLIIDVTKFCSKHVTPDSVILSQVKQSPGKQHKNYYVLKDNEVYSELPYTSSWLNINEQVDDIDKEFGFPPLMHRFHTFVSDHQPDHVETVNSIPALIESDLPNKVLSQTELEPVDSGDEKQASIAETKSTRTSSHTETESDDSSDPYCSFEIQILPLEEAKVIFDQIQSSTPQSMATDSQSKEVMKSFVEEKVTDVREVTLNDSKVEKEVASAIDEICCIARWMEKIVGSDIPSLSKCKYCNGKTLEMEESMEETNELCVISKVHSDTEGENEVKVKNLSVDINPNEDDEKLHSHSDRETENISLISINDSQSSIILFSENEDLSCTEREIPDQIPDFCCPISDPEEDCVQDQFNSVVISQSDNSDDSKKETKTVLSSEVASYTSDPEEDCAQVQLTSADMAEMSLGMEEQQTKISAMAAPQTTFSLSCKQRKRKALSSQERVVPFLKKLKKCRASQSVFKNIKCNMVFVDATDSEPPASNVRTAELVLYGSAHQSKGIVSGNRKSHVSSHVSPFGVQRPPEVLSVNVNPPKRKSSIPTSEGSVKQRIYEKWWRSCPPTKIQHTRKLKTQKRTFASSSGVSLKKTETAGHTKTKKLPLSSEMGIWNTNTKCFLGLKRSRSLSNRLKLGEENMRRNVVSLKRSNQERSDAERGYCAVKPTAEKNVLRFSVLPNTFNFVDGSNRRKETTDPMSGTRRYRSSSKTIKTARGSWCPRPEKKYCPLDSPPVTNTSSLFQEFQKKYKDKTQPSTDKQT